MKNNIISIRGVLGSDADFLFPLIHGSSVTDTIVWDGPTNLIEYKACLYVKAPKGAKMPVRTNSFLVKEGLEY
ncbi:MAG: hypothetical protein ACXVCY_18780 [Pseudobdellovibrionaceae bacterium]